MTKKYWQDWKTRVGETRNIYLRKKVYKMDGTFEGYGQKVYSPLIREIFEDKLLKTTFKDDTVEIVIERHYSVYNKSARNFQIEVENEHKTFKREEIASVEFYKSE